MNCDGEEHTEITKQVGELELVINSLNTLKTENEKLKDRIAWLEYGPAALNFALADNNTTGLDPICTCEGCLTSKRFTQLDFEEISNAFGHGDEQRMCIMRRCLGIQCARLGLVCLDINDEYGNIDVTEPTKTACRDISQLDCHIVFVNGFNSWDVYYGRLLAEEGFHKNPNLHKIKQLFTTLNDEDEVFFQDGDKNYFNIADGSDDTHST